jgi:hypothetical protein
VKAQRYFTKRLSWTFFFTAIFIIQAWSNWPGLESTRGWAPRYWDLSWVIQWSECFKTYGYDVYNFDSKDECTGYIYGSLLLKALNLMKITVEQSEILGHMNLILICIVLSYISHVLSTDYKVKRVFLVLVFTSPGIWLLLASGNFDSLMFVLVLLGVLSTAKGRVITAAIFFALGSLIKFYSLPLIPLLLLYAKRRVQICMILLTFSISLFFTLMDLTRTTSQSPGPNNYFFTFGVQNFGTWVELLMYKISGNYYEFSPLYIYLIGISSSIISIVLVYILLSRKKSQLIYSIYVFQNEQRMEVLFVFFSSIYLALFFQGTNYDYKLIFYIVAFLSLYASKNFTELKTFLSSVFLLSLWLTCFSFGFKSSFYPSIQISTVFTIIEFIGDVLNLIITSLLFICLSSVLIRKARDIFLAFLERSSLPTVVYHLLKSST